jgi:hypothetical protein
VLPCVHDTPSQARFYKLGKLAFYVNTFLCNLEHIAGHLECQIRIPHSLPKNPLNFKLVQTESGKQPAVIVSRDAMIVAHLRHALSR